MSWAEKISATFALRNLFAGPKYLNFRISFHLLRVEAEVANFCSGSIKSDA